MISFPPISAPLLKFLTTPSPPKSAGSSKSTRSTASISVLDVLDGVPEGRRDNEIFRYACRLRGKGLDYEEARQLLLEAAGNCTPPFPERQALKKLSQAWRFTPNNEAEPSGSTAAASTRAAESSIDDPDEAFTASQLLDMNLPDPTPVVQGLVPEGLSLLCGPPKRGKSWLALQIAVGVAEGTDVLGVLGSVHGDVLYLALEDGPRRLKKRLLGLLGDGVPFPDGLHFRTQFPRLDDGGMDLLESWLTEHTGTKLVVVDTLALVRKRAARSGTQYGDDYAALRPLKRLGDRFAVAVLVVHHTRKAASEDPLDSVSGTRGLIGCADSGLVLTPGKGRGRATLSVVGRDIEEVSYQLGFDHEKKRWELLDNTVEGKVETSTLPPERQRIVDLIAASGRAMGPTEISAALGVNLNTTKYRLCQMARSGEIISNASGAYLLRASVLVPARPAGAS